MIERERALRAEQNAIAGQRAAEAAREREADRADGAVDTVVGNPPRIAAQARSGELARIDASTGRVDTARPPSDIHYALVTGRGDVYLAAGRDVLRWAGAGFDRVATLPGRVATLDEIHGRDALAVITEQRAVYAVDLDPGPGRGPDGGAPAPDRLTRLFFRSSELPQINATSSYLAVAALTGDATVLDLTRGTRWRLPWQLSVATISPSGSTALLFRGGRVSFAPIGAPDDPAQLRDWIAGATNFTLDATGP